MNKILVKRITTIFMLLILLLVPVFTKSNSLVSDNWFNNSGNVIFSNDFDNETLTDPGIEVEDYITMTEVYDLMLQNRWNGDSSLKNNLNTLINGRTISISNADELYFFANAQSVNFNESRKENPDIYDETIKFILNQNYILLDDIDYSVKRAQKFVPIGTHIDLSSTNELDSEDVYHFPFTGEFDGNGFEISNLYLAEYPYITATFKDEGESSAITVALFKHYSMFSEIGETGVVKNFILRDPILEVATMDATSGLFNTSILAGVNEGLIYNVGVIDEKKTQAGLDNSGIIFNVAYPSNEEYKAAGFVFENKEDGEVYNSYLVTDRVVSSQSESRFNYVYPFVFINDGNISGVNYNDNIILINETNKPNNINSLEVIGKENIKTNTNINNEMLSNELKWEFYELDGYPQLKSLNYVSDSYEIHNDRDLIFFGHLIDLNTPKNNKPLNEHKFILRKHINMKNYTNFKTPAKEFKGELLGQNKYIYNMNLNKPHIVGNNYYLGLFSNLSGKVSNINFLNNKLNVLNSDNDYGKVFHVGMVSAKANNAIVQNINLENNIDLGIEALGLTYAGSLVGLASGTFENIHVTENNVINGNIHNFNNRTVNGSFYVGGVIGSNSSKITIKNSINKGEVTGVGSTNTNYNTSNSINSYVGGIIGEVNNIDNDTASLIYLTNEGLINANKFIGKNTTTNTNIFVGGIFGSTKGYGYKLNEGSNVYNGRLENEGEVKAEFINTNTYIYTAGIGIMNTTESYAKISYLINIEGYDFKDFNYQTHNTNMFYSQTVIDNSDGGVELSRAYNTKSYTLNEEYFNNDVSGANAPSEVEIGMFFVSTKNNPSRLLYVENRGNLTVGSSSAESTVNRKIKISNITQGTRIDYKNVVNSGNINVLNLSNNSNIVTNETNNSIYVAGVTWILPYDNRAYKMENILNEGNITTAGIKSNTKVIGNVTGPSFSDSTFSANLDVKNLYVAGIVNLNVGEIENSFNLGNITSKYDNSLKDINGTANTFVGGINTFNYNLIKDVANAGLIEYTNSSENSVSHFAATTNVSSNNNSTFGGISISYTGGIVAAGISSALGDISGFELEGHKEGASNIKANVIDTVNNGDIYAKAKEYVRSGGILGIALGVELASGTYQNSSSNVTPGPFTTAVIGSGDPVGQSLLSNGLNFGNIYAVTENIGNYGNDNYILTLGTGSGSNTANAIRPGIHAASGGVIAYGLTEMIRMINHGVISSTDVAGGIIGSTYILGGTSLNSTPITKVNISTAVHYGEIKAIKTGSYQTSGGNRLYVKDKGKYDSFEYIEHEDFTNRGKYYQLDEYEDFILYRGNRNENIERFQQARRGFGGIFGRLQRGNYGTMEAVEFKNVMNMDKNIDFVGRVDSNLHGSLIYYRFHNENTSYFTSKTKDTSPNAFVGWLTSNEIIQKNHAEEATLTITRSGNRRVGYTYSVTESVFTNVTKVREQTISRVVKESGNTENTRQIIEETRTFNLPFEEEIIDNETRNIGYYGLNNNIVSGLNYTNNIATYTINNGFNWSETIVQATPGGGENSISNNAGLRYPMHTVSDEIDENNSTYIFDENFSLMQPENSQYIYPVEEDALADRFKPGGANPKPNGMYVLSSSTGSMDGAALPTNININKLFKLEEKEETHYVDLNNVENEQLVNSSQSANNLINKYSEMFQLSYNDKSEILAEDESVSTLIGDLKLYDPNGVSPTLIGGVIDHINKTVTFNVSNDAFTDDDVYYEILSNELSKNAVISIKDINDNNEFKNAYNEREDNIIKKGDYKFSYDGSFSNNNITFDMRVYSEIAAEAGLTNKYYTDYQIIINRSQSNLSLNTRLLIDDIEIDNSNDFLKDYTNTNNMLNPSGKVELRFNETNQLPLKHKAFFGGLYIVRDEQETLIDSNYYDLNIYGKDESGNFGIIINFSDELFSGDYKIKYGYYDNNINRTITIRKEDSSNREVIDVNYNGFSNDLAGNDLIFSPTSNDFITYTKFGLEFNNATSSDQKIDVVPIYKVDENNANYKDYIDNINYYELYLENEYLLSIKLAPFAELDLESVYINYHYQNGKIIYNLKYDIKSEEGNYETITHTIEEREVTNPDIYLNNNLQTGNNIEITREGLLFTISLDYNFDEINYNNNIWFKVFNEDAEIINVPIDEIYEGEHSNLFNLLITNKLDKGEYRFELYIKRENNDYKLGNVNITKLPGSSAYLLDVRFTEDESDMIFEYPTIRVSDEFGVPNNSYDTRIFFDGIDYVGSDNGIINNFRIDARVSDLLLEDYKPIFTLPAGAKIEMYDTISNDWIEDLSADFVGYDEELEVVKYRIISEDESQTIYYHISITDLKYNLTLKFDIYYRDELGNIIKADDPNSPIKDSVVLIGSKNLKFSESFIGANSVITNVNEFPSVDLNDITGINNQSSLYHFINSNVNYRFGLNMSGGYNFNIITPKHVGQSNENQTLGERYNYSMYMKPRGFDINDWNKEEYKLPDMKQIDDIYSGLFYYVHNPSTNPIIRELAIVIDYSTKDLKWGLNDDFASWD